MEVAMDLQAANAMNMTMIVDRNSYRSTRKVIVEIRIYQEALE